MKKLLACTAALALLTGACFALPVSAEETTYRPGDVDMDGKLTAMDASLILDCYAYMNPLRLQMPKQLWQILMETVKLHCTMLSMCWYMETTLHVMST